MNFWYFCKIFIPRPKGPTSKQEKDTLNTILAHSLLHFTFKIQSLTIAPNAEANPLLQFLLTLYPTVPTFTI